MKVTARAHKRKLTRTQNGINITTQSVGTKKTHQGGIATMKVTASAHKQKLTRTQSGINITSQNVGTRNTNNESYSKHSQAKADENSKRHQHYLAERRNEKFTPCPFNGWIIKDFKLPIYELR
ncbi:hypothetical protein [Psychromonas antarctica]|uniref:hypothetical protein n=1 Tax=Psychromonas antarctica TaxID=67573 RepID=UPI001EE8F7C2|nr:hypothetical protein [Psychromonas antarctica]MCG6199665.1 hypothetical protein [Psychromonas antarctica]